MALYAVRGGNLLNLKGGDAEIKRKLAIYGYDLKNCAPINIKRLDVMRDMVRIHDSLVDVPPPSLVCGFECSIDDISTESEKIWSKFFKAAHIPYLDYDSIIEIYNQTSISTGSIEEQRKEIYGAVQRESSEISPFSLPIKLVTGHSMVGEINKVAFDIEGVSIKEPTPIIFSSVNLGENVSLLSAATLGHEVAHSQLERIKGSCTLYYHKEVVPIFIEKLMAMELDPSGELLKKSEEVRADWLRSCIYAVVIDRNKYSPEELLEYSAYIHSTVIADHLFDRYINGNSDIQSKILDDIQKIFNGDIKVYDMIRDNNVGWEESKKNIELIKRRSSLKKG